MGIFLLVLVSVTIICLFIKLGSKGRYEPDKIEKLVKMPVTSNPAGLCPDYVVIDLETTGLNAYNSEIIEIGAIKIIDHTEVERFHTYIKPCGGINPEAYKVNHIDYTTVQNAPTIENVKDNFLNFIGDLLLVGYNVKFDIEFIQTRMELRLYNPFLDVLPLARHWLDGLTNYKLETVKQALGIVADSHSAIGDCEATIAVLQHCVKLKNKTAFEQSPVSRIQQPLSETVEPYFNAVKEILATDLPGTPIFAQSYNADELYIYPFNSFVPFYFIKRSGKLKYWLSYSPVNIVAPICGDRFKCTAATKTEGINYTRIFIDGPNDILSLKEIVIRDYKNISAQDINLYGRSCDD